MLRPCLPHCGLSTPLLCPYTRGGQRACCQRGCGAPRLPPVHVPRWGCAPMLTIHVHAEHQATPPLLKTVHPFMPGPRTHTVARPLIPAPSPRGRPSSNAGTTAVSARNTTYTTYDMCMRAGTRPLIVRDSFQHRTNSGCPLAGTVGVLSTQRLPHPTPQTRARVCIGASRTFVRLGAQPRVGKCMEINLLQSAACVCERLPIRCCRAQPTLVAGRTRLPSLRRGAAPARPMWPR